jgi:hypothetical protein
MKVVALLVPVWLGAASAQDSAKPAAETADRPALQNNGKPMQVACDCSTADIQSAGLSCTIEEPCPLFLELDSVGTAGNRIFLAGNIHTASTTLYSVLLASEDGGKTWREPYERMHAADLDRIQFVDFANGWISGEMQQPLPRDPFLLVTSDGGETWRTRPVFGDPQFGSILTFGFSSKSNGSMVIDRGGAAESGRYELYETPDAGETWMLRQTNARPIPMKHPAPTNADWRLRADAASKSYRVEHRVGITWRNVAAFAVSIGVCKPAEAPAPPADEGATSPQKPPPSGQ